MGAWVLWGGGSRNGGGKLERGGVSEPKPRAPAPAPAQRALAFGIQGGGGRVPGAGGGRRGAARVRLGVWPCAGNAWRGPAACVIGSTCKKKIVPLRAENGTGPDCVRARVRLLRADSTGWCTEGVGLAAALMGSSTDKVGTGPAWQAFQLEAGCSLDRNRPILITQWASITTKPDFPSPARPVVRASITRPAQACAGMAAATFIAV